MKNRQIDLERDLAETRQRLELAVEGARMGMWDWHVPSGKVTFNDIWSEILGYAPSDIHPSVAGWEKLLHPADIQNTWNMINDNLDGKTSYYVNEHRLLARDGSWRWVQARGRVAERDSDGNPVRHIGFHMDCHKTKQTELALLEARSGLERKVEERTSELEEAKDSAVSSNITKSQFLVNMSLELQTPMDSVLANLGMLAEDDLSERQIPHLSAAADSAEDLLSILNDIVEYSRIEADALYLSALPFDPCEIALNVEKLLRPTAGFKGLSLVLKFRVKDNVRLIGDAARYRQVLVYLVGNAIKFTENGSVTLELFTEEMPSGDTQLATIVRTSDNTLPGKPRNAALYNFGGIERASDRRYGGAGLSLAISSELVSVMGGELILENLGNQGNTLSFRLACEVD